MGSRKALPGSHRPLDRLPRLRYASTRSQALWGRLNADETRSIYHTLCYRSQGFLPDRLPARPGRRRQPVRRYASARPLGDSLRD